MRKFYFISVVILAIFCFAACGKKKNRSEYEGIDHYKEPTKVDIVTPTPTCTATPTTTPTIHITNDDIMNSYHREENIIEVEISIVCAIAYSEPYSGKALGYLVGEDFITSNFYWADHNNRVGFDVSCIKGLYEADDRGIIHPVEFVDSDGVIWVHDGDAVFNLVPHPENYDSVDWGQ